ncbi:MAG: PAS domain S-box protein, partial [Acidobacteria bacterium]|nr:PAS domain S-box protein [Acidobacteriota bacterium]
MATVMPAGNFYIALYDRARELLEFPYFRDEEDPPPGAFKPGKGLTEYVIRTGRPLLCDEATDRDLRGRGEVGLVGAPSAIWLGVPLIVDGVTIGAMVVQHYSDPNAYGPAELRMFEYVSSQVARSIWRKGAEEALRRNEQRLSHHIQQTPLAVIEWDKEFKVRQWNRAAERIFGFTAAEAVGRHASFIVPEAYRGQVDEVWRGLLAGTSGERSTNENVTKDGRAIACEWYNTPLVDSEGQVTGVASLAQDITERRRTEAALRDSEELYRRLVAAIPDMIVRTDLEGTIVFANEVAVRRSGSARVEDLVGRNIFSFVVAEEREKAVTAAARMFDKKIGPQELGLVFPGGSPIRFEVEGSVLHPLRGRGLGPPRARRPALRRRVPVPRHDRAQAGRGEPAPGPGQAPDDPEGLHRLPVVGHRDARSLHGRPPGARHPAGPGHRRR